MKSYVIPHEYTLEEKGFVLSGAVLKINSKSENNQWQVTRRGSGHVSSTLSNTCTYVTRISL